MSQNIRATPRSSGRQGSTAKVDASGMAIMSDSSIALKPVIDAHRYLVGHAAADDALRLELLHPLREEPVREVRHQLLHLGEARRAVHQDQEDRAGPALAHELHGSVISR